jgi:acylphosphatase
MSGVTVHQGGRGRDICQSSPKRRDMPGSRRAIFAIWRDGRRTQNDRSGTVDGTGPSAVADELFEIKRLTIHGGVQGVGYRAFVEREAVQLGLTGWVRNRRDGTVESIVAGPPAAVIAMIARCQDGPPLARVHTVAAEPARAIDLELGSAGAFVIIATA